MKVSIWRLVLILTVKKTCEKEKGTIWRAGTLQYNTALSSMVLRLR